MTPNRIALVTTAPARMRDDDLAPLESALQALGADVTLADWDDAALDWSHFDLALLRSPWDYVERLPEFLGWAERTAARTRLLNPLEVLRWMSTSITSPNSHAPACPSCRARSSNRARTQTPRSTRSWRNRRRRSSPNT